MPGSIFEDVDHYIDSLFTPDEDILSNVLTRAEAAGLPDIHISPGQGKFLYLLAKMIGAKRILEAGLQVFRRHLEPLHHLTMRSSRALHMEQQLSQNVGDGCCRGR